MKNQSFHNSMIPIIQKGKKLSIYPKKKKKHSMLAMTHSTRFFSVFFSFPFLQIDCSSLAGVRNTKIWRKKKQLKQQSSPSPINYIKVAIVNTSCITKPKHIHIHILLNQHKTLTKWIQKWKQEGMLRNPRRATPSLQVFIQGNQ